MDRRKFLKTMLGGSVCAFLMPSLLFGQMKTAKKNPKTLLEYIIANPDIDRKEKEAYKNLNIIMNNAIRYKGVPLPACRIHLNFGDEDWPVKIQPEYYDGKLRFLVYFLDEKEWYNSKSIYDFHLYYFSENETKLSIKTFEVNLNQLRGLTNYWDIRERRLEGEEIVNKFEKGLYTVTKKLFKVRKKDLKEVMWGIDYLKDMISYERKQELVQIANLITGNHVYVRDLKYNAFATFLWQADKGVRAVKLAEFEISRGELSCSCYGIAMRGVKFEGKNRILSRPEGVFVPFNLEELIKKPKHKIN